MRLTREPAASGHRAPAPILSVAAYLAVLATESLPAAIVVSAYGKAASLRSGGELALIASIVWIALTLWAVVFSAFIQRFLGLSRNAALLRAAGCHLALALCIVPIMAINLSPASAAAFFSPDGQLLFPLLARDYVVLAPLALQLVVVLVGRRQNIAPHMPAVAIMILAFGLRFSHAGWGLPGLLHADEHKYIGQAIIAVARGDLHPHYFENPSLMIYVAALLFWTLTDHSVAFHIADQLFTMGIPDPRGDYLQMIALRGSVAIAGTATVWAVYAATKELFGKRAALFAGTILAVAFLPVRNSHYATNDTLAVAFLSLSFLFAARIYTRGRLLDYLLAGLLGGLATTTKYNAGFFFVPIVVAHLLHSRGTRDWRSRAINMLPLVGSGVASILGFLAGTPYALLDYPAFIEDFRNEFRGGSTLITGVNAPPVPLLYLETLFQGFGVLPLLLAILGVAIGIRGSHRERTLLALVTPAVLLCFMLTQALFCARFALPLMPSLAILAGYGISRLLDSDARGSGANWIQIAVLAMAIAQPLAFTLQADRILGREDTRSQAARWIDANVPRGTAIAMEAWAHLDNKFKWAGFEGRDVYIFWAEGEKGREQAMNGDYRYVVTSSFGYEPWQMDGAPESLVPPEYRYLRSKGRLRAAFAPGLGSTDLPYSQDEMYSPFWHIFDRERPGPTVRIYEMP